MLWWTDSSGRHTRTHNRGWTRWGVDSHAALTHWLPQTQPRSLSRSHKCAPTSEPWQIITDYFERRTRSADFLFFLPQFARGCVLFHRKVQDPSRVFSLQFRVFYARDSRLLRRRSKMTGVFENLNTDMHSSQITSNSYHSLHKSQESPTLPVSTATDSSYYNGQQPGHCAASSFDQLGSYQYHGSTTGSVPYNAKSYDLGFSSSYGAFSYGSTSSPAPADTGEKTLSLISDCTWISVIS